VIKFYINNQGTVTIHTQALKRFWAHTYAYYTFYDYLQNNGWKYNVNFGENEQTLRASKLLKWAVDSDKNPYNPNKYPDDTLRPFEIREDSSLSVCARDITIFGLGYILLHEIAHIELKHIFNADKPTSIQQEYEADKWAAHFVMDFSKDNTIQSYPNDHSAHNAVGVKRLLALVASNYWLIKDDCYYGVSKNKTHPPTFERLNVIIEEFVLDDNHPLWAMSELILSMHLHPYIMQDQKYLTHKERCQYYMNFISKI